jgi:ubiquinol-cytochrome c reductase cytochrome c subunit
MRSAAASALVALVVCGTAAAQEGALVQRGRELYLQGCVSCHGPDANGVEPGSAPPGAGGIDGAGPSLVGVGERSADLYLSAGYMPLRNPDDQPRRRDPLNSRDDIRALVAYIGSLGGPRIPQVRPERGSIAAGLRLFTENCAGCHQIVGEGGYVVGGIAPPLRDATPVQIAEAVRVGPFLMPSFGERQLSDRELDSVIRYVEFAKDPADEGGWSIGRLGPIPEGLVTWLVAGLALVVLARVIGERRR